MGLRDWVSEKVGVGLFFQPDPVPSMGLRDWVSEKDFWHLH